ncbi:hypothetical protein [Anabaena sp. CCY 9614]
MPIPTKIHHFDQKGGMGEIALRTFMYGKKKKPQAIAHNQAAAN